MKRKLEDRGYGSKIGHYIYLGTNPGGSFSYYYYPSTATIECFNGSIERHNHMSYSKADEFFKNTEPIDKAIEMLQME